MEDEDSFDFCGHFHRILLVLFVSVYSLEKRSKHFSFLF